MINIKITSLSYELIINIILLTSITTITQLVCKFSSYESYYNFRLIVIKIYQIILYIKKK